MRIFEDDFSDTLTNMVYLSLEYCKKSVDKIFIYCFNENNCISSNVFFMKDGKKINRSKLSGILDSEQIKFIRDINNKVKDIKVLCLNNNQSEPTEIKIIYELTSKRMITDFNYEKTFTKYENVTLQENFNTWFEMVK